MASETEDRDESDMSISVTEACFVASNPICLGDVGRTLVERRESKYHYVARHESGDFGDVGETVTAMNTLAIQTNKGVVMSRYRVGSRVLLVLTNLVTAGTTLSFEAPIEGG